MATGWTAGVVIAGANVLERRLLAATIESIVVERLEPTAAMGGRADVRMAVEVPRDPGAVREEGHQLPRADSAGFGTVLVSQAPPHGSM